MRTTTMAAVMVALSTLLVSGSASARGEKQCGRGLDCALQHAMKNANKKGDGWRAAFKVGKHNLWIHPFQIEFIKKNKLHQVRVQLSHKRRADKDDQIFVKFLLFKKTDQKAVAAKLADNVRQAAREKCGALFTEALAFGKSYGKWQRMAKLLKLFAKHKAAVRAYGKLLATFKKWTGMLGRKKAQACLKRAENAINQHSYLQTPWLFLRQEIGVKEGGIMLKILKFAVGRLVSAGLSLIGAGFLSPLTTMAIELVFKKAYGDWKEAMRDFAGLMMHRLVDGRLKHKLL